MAGWIQSSIFFSLIGRTGNAKSPVGLEGEPPHFNQAMISSPSADLTLQSREVFCYRRIGISRSAKTSLEVISLGLTNLNKLISPFSS